MQCVDVILPVSWQILSIGGSQCSQINTLAEDVVLRGSFVL